MNILFEENEYFFLKEFTAIKFDKTSSKARRFLNFSRSKIFFVIGVCINFKLSLKEDHLYFS